MTDKVAWQKKVKDGTYYSTWKHGGGGFEFGIAVYSKLILTGKERFHNLVFKNRWLHTVILLSYVPRKG